MALDGFLFVNAGDTSSSSHKASSNARAFVMRKARADQVWSTRSTKLVDRRKNRDAGEGNPRNKARSPRQPSRAPILDQESQESQIVRLTSSSTHVCRQCYRRASAPSRQICAFCLNSPFYGATHAYDIGIDGSLDPFSSVAVVLDRGANMLLHYFDRLISPQITPIGGMLQPTKVQQGWLAPSFHQPAFMHAILCLTALQMSISLPQEPQYQVMAMHHRLQAIKAVQQNLSDPDKAVSDENIAAVFNLLCVEENLFLPAFAPIAESQLQADTAQRLAHMQGLKKMIGARGGVRGLSSSRALQSFLLRHTAVQAVTSFEVPYLLPTGLISHLYDYPESSRFYLSHAPMAMACCRAGMARDLTEIVKSAECLIEDTKDWLQAPHTYKWDALDVQNLYSISIDRFVRWYMENESTLSHFEGIVALCSTIFLAFVCRSKEAVYSAIPSLLSRLKRHIMDTDVGAVLRISQLDIWVGLLVVLGSEGHPTYEVHFFQSYLDILATRSPLLHSFGDVKALLQQCLWIPRPMDMYADEVWNETPTLWKSPRRAPDLLSGVSGYRLKSTRTRANSSSASSASNPYTNGHPQAHITVESSAYNL